jgi:tRNA (guanine-N7-)-methyltransferase
MEEFELDLTKLPQPVEWESLFGNTNPVEIEIGFGKGRFLLRSAWENPGKNYLGIERSRKCFRITHARILKRGLKNIRLVMALAEEFIPRFIPDNSISTYHIYFPDPWPKRRHAKRRLFKENFVIQLERTLVPGGRLNIATDVEGYYQVILDLIARHTRLSLVNQWRFPAADEPQAEDNNLKTWEKEGLGNYEIKYRKEGRKIYYGSFEKGLDKNYSQRIP